MKTAIFTLILAVVMSACTEEITPVMPKNETVVLISGNADIQVTFYTDEGFVRTVSYFANKMQYLRVELPAGATYNYSYRCGSGVVDKTQLYLPCHLP